jgi:hypothetical protein
MCIQGIKRNKSFLNLTSSSMRHLCLFHIFFFNYIIILLGYIVIFTKVLTIYELNSPPPLFAFIPYYSPNLWDNFNMSYFSIFMNEYTLFIIFTDPLTLSVYPPLSLWYQPHRQDLCYLSVLYFWK